LLHQLQNAVNTQEHVRELSQLEQSNDIFVYIIIIFTKLNTIICKAMKDCDIGMSRLAWYVH